MDHWSALAIEGVLVSHWYDAMWSIIVYRIGSQGESLGHVLVDSTLPSDRSIFCLYSRMVFGSAHTHCCCQMC